MKAPRTLGRRPALLLAAVAAAALGATALGGLRDPRQALFSYLAAYAYWAGIAVAALILLMAFHASAARWVVVIRRLLEVVPLSLAALLPLFLPVALGAGILFPWAGPPPADPEVARLWLHRRPVLNLPFFLIRALAYLAIWLAVAHLLHAWSVRQDREGGVALTRRQRQLGAGALPLLAVTMTFAAYDWLMSLEPHLVSTVFGVYWFAGSFVAAIAVLILGAVLADRAGLLGGGFQVQHLHSLGKLLLAFVIFWAYIAFSQWMLTWIANLPGEVPWLVARNRGGWAPVGLFLLAAHFAVPFLLLLSRERKRRPGPLAALAGWILLVHYVDVYWLVLPVLHPGRPALSWLDLTALVGVGAAAAATALWRLGGAATVPVGDPYLEDSRRYQPQ